MITTAHMSNQLKYTTSRPRSPNTEHLTTITTSEIRAKTNQIEVPQSLDAPLLQAFVVKGFISMINKKIARENSERLKFQDFNIYPNILQMDVDIDADADADANTDARGIAIALLH